MGIARQEDPSFTYKDYLSWGDEERRELIDGVAYSMVPAPGTIHQGISGELFYQLRAHLDDRRCRVFAAPFDVRLPERDEADDAITTVVQPDISVICDPSKLDERGCRGAPDIIVEILSPTTAHMDKIKKFYLYEKRGVAEYWLVHPADRTVTVYSLGPSSRYGRPDLLADTDTLESHVLKGLKIDLSTVFPPRE